MLGICNGFQVLCEAGLLPGALIRNDVQTFVCRDQPLVVERARGIDRLQTGAMLAVSLPEPAVRELLELLLAGSGVRPEVTVDQARWRPADSCVGCAERLAKAVGWAPRIPLSETLERLLDDWRQKVGAG